MRVVSKKGSTDSDKSRGYTDLNDLISGAYHQPGSMEQGSP